MKKLLNNLDTAHYGKLEHSFQLALENLNKQLILQMEGIQELNEICTLLLKIKELDSFFKFLCAFIYI